MKRHCYYCGSTATTKEHVPPKQLFKAFQVDCITVPSCEKHNTDKSGDDEAIIKSMLLSFEANRLKLPYNGDIYRALDVVKNHYSQVKNRVRKHKLFGDEADELEFAYIDDRIDINQWIRQISAGIIYSRTHRFDKGNDYGRSYVYKRNIYKNEKQEYIYDDIFRHVEQQKIYQSFFENNKWLNGWSSGKNTYPKTIFEYKYQYSSTNILFKYIFYENYTFYNNIEISQGCIELLKKS